MGYHFYTTSKAAWKGMLSAISGAKKSIYLEMYIFQGDTKGFDFLSVLEEKARSGVQVILILDSFGSSGLSSHVIRNLRLSGVEVLFFSYWFRRLHRKTLVVDEKVVFLGGVNISGAFAPWKDMQLRLGGKKFISASIRSFARVYEECGGKNIGMLSRIGKEPLLKKTKTWFIEHGIGGKWFQIREHYEEQIGKAERSVILVTPYFFPRRWLIACIHEAILRGVLVEIIIPQYTDQGWFMDRVNYFQLSFFTKLGALCFLSREMNHAKILLIDDRVGMVGSGNLDPLSFGWNAEAGVFFDRAVMVRDLRKILEEWKSDSIHFTVEMFQPHWHDIFLAFFRRLF